MTTKFYIPNFTGYIISHQPNGWVDSLRYVNGDLCNLKVYENGVKIRDTSFLGPKLHGMSYVQLNERWRWEGKFWMGEEQHSTFFEDGRAVSRNLMDVVDVNMVVV